MLTGRCFDSGLGWPIAIYSTTAPPHPPPISEVIPAHQPQLLPIPQWHLLYLPPSSQPACLFKAVFVYAEAQLGKTCAGSARGSFHRGSILFLIKWHSVAGGLAGTQLPGKPKNAGLHLATNSQRLRRASPLLSSALGSGYTLLLRGACMCVCLCHSGMGLLSHRSHFDLSLAWHFLCLFFYLQTSSGQILIVFF